MRKAKFLAGALTAAMLMSMLPIHALAADSDLVTDGLDKLPDTESVNRGYPYSDGVVLNKTAVKTGSDKYAPANVTLSITGTSKSDEEQQPDTPDITAPIIIEFVVDATGSLFATGNENADSTTAEEWIDSMVGQLSGKNAHVGLTLFTNEAKVAASISEEILTAGDADALKEQIAASKDLYLWGIKSENLGTNVQAGILTGTKELQNFNLEKYPNARKYLVLITDGGAFWWNDDEGNKLNSYLLNADGSKTYAQNNMAAERAQKNKNAALQYTDVNSFDSAIDLIPNQVEAKDVVGEENWLSFLISNPEKYPVTDFEKGIYAACKAVDAIPNTIHLVTIGYPYYDHKSEFEQLTGLADSFLNDKCAVKGSFIEAKSATDTTALVQLTAALAEDAETTHNSNVSDITDSIKTVIAADSVVTDIIGKGAEKNSSERLYNFDVDTAEEMIYTFNDETMTGTLENGQISFQDAAGRERALLTYRMGDETNGNNEEVIKLTIRDAIAVNDKVTLTYTVNLTDKNMASGSHTLYPNNQATLKHQTTAGAWHTKLFPLPVYNYSVSSGGGGSSSKPEVNRDDHYAYIVGYPEDYQTGKPTQDKNRWPVKPQNNITREEAATIFFRLLTDESRERAWSTFNSFPDVADSRWSNNAVSTIYKAEIISGYPNGTFRPASKITRAEFATIAARFSDKEYDSNENFTDTQGHWAHDFIQIAVQEGWISGYPDGTFKPDQYITRAEAMTLINAVLSRKPDTDHLHDDMVQWPDNPITAWYYAQVQEATNSHDYKVRSSYDETEVWVSIIPTRDWSALEDPSNDQYLKSNAGDVIQ